MHQTHALTAERRIKIALRRHAVKRKETKRQRDEGKKMGPNHGAHPPTSIIGGTVRIPNKRRKENEKHTFDHDIDRV